MFKNVNNRTNARVRAKNISEIKNLKQQLKLEDCKKNKKRKKRKKDPYSGFVGATT